MERECLPDREQRLMDLKKENLTSAGRAIRKVEICRDAHRRSLTKHVSFYLEGERKRSNLAAGSVSMIRRSWLSAMASIVGSASVRESAATGS